MELNEAERAELEKLRLFKKTVHDRLDAAGIPKCETEECRVAARLDIALRPTVGEMLYWSVRDFQEKVIGFPIPDQPRCIEGKRLEYCADHLQEELDEFVKASLAGNIEEAADGIVDLVYVALGRLVEMGVNPHVVFEEVHHANMMKRRGDISKRPNAMGYDAIKPEGWTPPDLRQWLVPRHVLQIAVQLQERYERENPYRPIRAHVGGARDPENNRCSALSCWCNEEDRGRYLGLKPRNPRILLLGHGRHGKDTVAEMLRDSHDFNFTSSSHFCAKEVVFPALRDKYGYPTWEACYEDRANHRQEWYEAIAAFNSPDKTRLARAIFSQYDIYAGMRHSTEFHAGDIAGGVWDVVVWVDASHRLPPEGRESCTVEPWMADYVLDNNGTLDDLRLNLKNLMERINNDRR